MYSPFQLAKKYLHYYLTASNGKGHGIHSPFVFDFIQHVLNDKKQYPCYAAIEAQRKKLRSDTTLITVEDFGAGAAKMKSNIRAINAIAATSLKPAKYARLLFRMVQYYKPATLLELGTSFGITTAYLASGNPSARVYTCEGASQIAEIAQKNFDHLGLQNIHLIKGDFKETLPQLMKQVVSFGFAFIDGNHRKVPAIQYFEKLLLHSTPDTILVFDDIHWSSEMEEAWLFIQQHPAVTLTIDLFFIGIVCIKPSIKVKQHFRIAY